MQRTVRETTIWLLWGEGTLSPFEYLAVSWVVKNFKCIEAVTNVPHQLDNLFINSINIY
jgi:hypothetical protein